MPAILALRRRLSLDLTNSRPAWATQWDPALKQNKNSYKMTQWLKVLATKPNNMNLYGGRKE